MDTEKAFNVVGTFGRFQIFTTSTCFLANTTQFNLYDEGWVTDLMQSLFMGGFMLGCFAFGQLADIIGRKPVMVVCGALSGITGIFSGLVTTWQTFAASRLLAGVFVGGLATTNFVVMAELIGRDKWVTVGVIYQCFFSIGIMLLSLIAFVSKQWRVVCYVTGGFGMLILPLICYLPESPRWLYSVGKTKDSEKVFRELAQKNKVMIEQEIILAQVVVNEEEKTNNFTDIFRHKKLALWMVIMGYVWFTCALVYYGLTLSAADLTSDLYVGIVLSGAVEIPANLICVLMLKLKWLGRKGTLMTLFLVCGASNLASIFLQGSPSAELGLGLTSKLSITASFAMIYIYTSEIFPTTLRNVAVSASATVARLGAILASFVSLLSDTLSYAPYIMFCAAVMLGFVLAIFLPETRGTTLLRAIDDVDNGGYRQQVNDWDTSSNVSQDSSDVEVDTVEK